MKFLSNIWKKKIRIGSFFGATSYEMKNFLCGTGESEIQEHTILVRNYPFEPSTIYPAKEIQAKEIDEIHPDQHPPTLKIKDELIFIAKTSVEKLREFAVKNNIRMAKRAANWEWITEPFLDTAFDEQQQKATLRFLESNGIPEDEVVNLRKMIGKQLYKYNFDTMLWEWGALGLFDVLAAMRPKLTKAAFEDFYRNAMEIEQRSNSAASG